MPEGVVQVGGIEVPHEYFLRAPAALFVSGEDRLRLVSLNSLASVVLTISGRFLSLHGGPPKAFSQAHTPNTDRTTASIDIPLGDGWLLGATIVASTASPILGQTWAQLQLIRGASGATVVLQTLAAGYVTATQHLAWPGSPLRSPLEGAGALRSIAGTDPAAGANFSETVPTGARWRLLGLNATFTTSATAANRVPRLVLDDGTDGFFRCDPGTVQTASTARFYSTGPGAGRQANVSLNEVWGVPAPVILPAGARIQSEVSSLQAGDDWSALQLLVEEWLEGN